MNLSKNGFVALIKKFDRNLIRRLKVKKSRHLRWTLTKFIGLLGTAVKLLGFMITWLSRDLNGFKFEEVD